MSKICGIFYTNKIYDKKVIGGMINTLSKRGPDGHGIYKGKNFILGHTRLSIIDTSENGKQPMESDKSIVSFNGEIYNYNEIKRYLVPDFKYKSKTDTEVIISLYEKYGIDGWKHLNGIFAFIFYDKIKKQTYFLRDIMGVKPLYYYYSSGDLIVGTKISTIMCATGKLPINYRGVNDILFIGYNRTPIYQKVYDFEPGVVYNQDLKKTKIEFVINPNKTIKDAIIEQFINSDRPIGISLSGGVDSSYLAYVCSKVSKNKIHTFTIGFSDKDDDIINARKVAKYIKSEHHEIIVSPNVYEQNLKEGLERLEAPFDLGSVAVTNLLGKEISKFGIKVLLCGDGNDEVSMGYRRYKESPFSRTSELWEWYKKRITKNNFEERKKILGDNTYAVEISDEGFPNDSNRMSWCDIKNELLYYHNKRIDHIISDYGIEVRVPYEDYSFVMNTLKEPFTKKVNAKGNKMLLRNFAIQDGLPEEFAMVPKIPFKRKDFNTKNHLIKIWQEFAKENKII